MIADGSYESEAQVVTAALELLQKRRALIDDVNAGIAQLECGEGIPGDEVFRWLQEGIESPTIPADELFARLDKKVDELAGEGP